MTDFPRTERICIEFATMEGAVLRMLGLVERRGFRIRGVSMNERSGGESGSLALQLAPDHPARSVCVLAAQLGRLHGVESVSHDRAVEQVA